MEGLNFIDLYSFSLPCRKDLMDANQLFERSLKDIVDNWDYYYQLYLEDVVDIGEDV